MRLPIKGEYPPEWPQVSYAVKVASDWRCIRCLHLDPRRGRQWFGLPVSNDCDDRCRHRGEPGKMRALTVHHLDGNKANLCWWNLLALCQACHLSVQARVLPERPWLWEHADWFRPYVAGFYAAYYGHVFLSCDETVARIDELLALGQPWRHAAIQSFVKS